MSVQDEQIEEIEITIGQAKELVAMAKSMQNLITNPDFKKVILDGYFKEEASRLVLFKADPVMQTVEHQANMLKRIDAIGYFEQYLRGIRSMGQQAERDILAAEETIEEILAEQPNNTN